MNKTYTSNKPVLIKGPCVVCGMTDYTLSLGGPAICPACDCGIAPTDRRHPKNHLTPDAYLIWSYEHGAWWGPGRYGYTRDWLKAGLYTKAEATEICADANRHSAEPKECVVPLQAAATFRP